MAFHEVLFPIACSARLQGGPERRTDIVETATGFEERNQRWADSRRRWQAGNAIRTIDELRTVVAFFEERRGRFHGFRLRDRLDSSSAADGGAPAPTDQVIGTGNGTAVAFQLCKTYGQAFDPYARRIVKPVAGTVRVALDGVEQASGWSVDVTTGVVTFDAAPGAGVAVSAGFRFDVPVRFDTDFLDVDLGARAAGTWVNLPIVELRL